MDGNESAPAEQVFTCIEGSYCGKPETAIRLSPCRCRSGFCADCRVVSMIRWREALRPAVSDWASAYMLTLTVDPKRFPEGPEACWKAIMRRRWIAETVRKLKRRGYLLSERWFYAMEFHRSGFPHWHVAVESDFVPFQLLKETWGYGGVRFSRQKGFQNPAHAVHYLTKYVGKPEVQCPEWVLTTRARVRLVSTSRGLLEPRSKLPPQSDEIRPVKQRTIKERLAVCKQAVNVLRVQPVMGGNLYRFEAKIDRPWQPWMAGIQTLGQLDQVVAATAEQSPDST